MIPAFQFLKAKVRATGLFQDGQEKFWSRS